MEQEGRRGRSVQIGQEGAGKGWERDGFSINSEKNTEYS